VALPGEERDRGDEGDRGDVRWHPFTALFDEDGPKLLDHQVDAVRAQLNTELRRPVASLLHMGAAASVTAPLLAVAAMAGFVPELSPPSLQLGYSAGGRLHLETLVVPERTHTTLLPALADQLIATGLEGLLAPFTAALTTVVGLPEPTLAGNTFSALAAAARLIQPADLGARARAIVDLVARRYLPLSDAGVLNWRSPETAGYFRRRNCCLFYQVPGGGTCGDCILEAK
jgi:ferric iron reductase protein FhuF